MRLRSIEIKGFKSFADHTTVHFNESVTGIVGPNGSGKSNVIDAIRWVLGEQKSRELRLDSMRDVLFNGTDKRKKSRSAQVTIHFDNTKNILPIAYTTVSVSRTLFADGASEYQLNGVKCRLKDIQNLFVDSGIGSNSYAIIALGMVDDILADKDNARRRMFEQAAGISKYRSSKKITERKLTKTIDDLNRVEDLLHEIESNLKSLEKQAKRAERYLKIKAEYKEKSIDLARFRIISFKDEYKKLKQLIAEKQDHLVKQTALVNKLESEIEKHKAQNSSESSNLSAAQIKLNKKLDEIRSNESALQIKEQELKFSLQTKERLGNQIKNWKNQLEILDTKLKEKSTEILTLQTQYEKDNEDLKKQEAFLNERKAELTTHQSKLDQLLSSQKQIQDKIIEREKQMAILENQLADFQITLQNEQKSLEAFQESLAQHQELLEKSKKDREVLAKKKKSSIQELEAQKKIIEDHEKNHNLAQQQISRFNRKIDAASNEQKILQDMLATMEGFPDSIRFLSKSRQGKIMLVQDLFVVSEDYRAIVEDFLDPILSYIVVEERATAWDYIHDVRYSQKGKIGVFVLDELKDAVQDFTLHKSIGDHITVKSGYEALLKYLFHNVTLENSLDKDRIVGSGIHLTNEDEYIRKEGMIRGGSIGLFDGKRIGRQEHIDALTEKIVSWEKQLSKEKLTCRNIEKALESLNNTVIQDKIRDLHTQLEHVDRDIFRIEHLISKTESDIAAKKTSIEYIETKKDSSQQQLQQLRSGDISQDDHANLDADIPVIKSKIKDINDRIAQENEVFQDQRIKATQLSSKINQFELEIKFEKAKKQEAESGLEKDKYDFKNQNEREQTLTKEIDALNSALQTNYKERITLKEDLRGREEEFKNFQIELDKKEKERVHASKGLHALQSEINNAKDAYNGVKFKIQGISERLNIEFNISTNDLLKEQEPVEVDEHELEARIDKLRTRIHNFGEVNPLAMEAYDEMKLRYDDIEKQKNDILEAKDTLEKTISKIEEEATSRFLESIDAIGKNFKEVFRSLFGEEDEASIVLLDPENALDSQIEIVAKPKGKRPQSLSQLSGGEKTLTATALLFSLYLLKPAPFCIFDEVDAPLDDANVLKFNNIIRNFSDNSQFIVVTHNKLTMSEVDVIYGVYMKEPGVSGVSAVDFRNLAREDFELSSASSQ